LFALGGIHVHIIAILAISAFGALIALITLPELVQIPLWIDGALLLISVSMALTRFARKEMLTWCASAAITFYWAVVQITGALLAYTTEVIGFNPKVLYMVLYIPLAIILCLGLFVAAHIVHDRQTTIPSLHGRVESIFLCKKTL